MADARSADTRLSEARLNLGYTRVDALRAQGPNALFNAMHEIAQEVGHARDAI